ncbi:flagellar export protein FliJ [Castellaniella sp. MT123]|uniref:flagellar export protein FliJ n=1 Tax=Castellaniella sp. MT123 TaxID=3140381 RepID=UPI0031F3E2BA
MPHETPLDVLINLAQDKLDAAGRALSELGEERRNAQKQLSTLDTYRGDYTQRLQDTTAGGVSASNYHNFRHFIATLDEAISQQNSIIAQIDTRIEAGRQRWHDEKRRLSSYETLKARQVRQLQYHEQRWEQRASDEISAGLYRRTRQPH